MSVLTASIITFNIVTLCNVISSFNVFVDTLMKLARCNVHVIRTLYYIFLLGAILTRKPGTVLDSTL